MSAFTTNICLPSLQALQSSILDNLESDSEEKIKTNRELLRSGVRASIKLKKQDFCLSLNSIASHFDAVYLLDTFAQQLALLWHFNYISNARGFYMLNEAFKNKLLLRMNICSTDISVHQIWELAKQNLAYVVQLRDPNWFNAFYRRHLYELDQLQRHLEAAQHLKAEILRQTSFFPTKLHQVNTRIEVLSRHYQTKANLLKIDRVLSDIATDSLE